MRRRLLLASFAIFTATTLLHADTLILNDGRRLQGELVAVNGRDIEFEDRSGGRRRIVRISRDEVDRIEFSRSQRDDYRTEPSGFPPRGMRERQVVVDARELGSPEPALDRPRELPEE